MTDQEMIDEVADAVGNSVITTRILRWLNKRADYLARKFVLEWLRTTGASLSITANQGTYDIGDVAYLVNLWSPERVIYPIDERELAAVDPGWNTQVGQVSRYVLNGTTLILYQIPDADDTLYYSYQKRPVRVVAGKTTEYLGFPWDWHELLCLGAELNGFKYENNQEQYAQVLAEYNSTARELKMIAYRRPDFRHQIVGPRRIGIAEAQLDPTQFAEP